MLDSRFVIPKSNAIKSLIHSSFTHTFNILLNKLSLVNYVACTTDLWTARNRQGYLGVTCSWIDDDYNLNENLLVLSHLPSPHTAASIHKKLENVFIEWKLNEKVTSITCDNGRT